MRKLSKKEKKVQISIMIDPGLLKNVDKERRKGKKTRSTWINSNLSEIFDMKFNKPGLIS